MRRLRVPSFVTFLFALENEQECCLVTEEVASVLEVLTEVKKSPDWVAWGLQQVVTGLSFLHGSASGTLVHGNVQLSSVFVTPGGEWKLAGLEVLGEAGKTHPLAASKATLAAVVPRAYQPPECKARGEWAGPAAGFDLYQLACLMYEVYNGVGSIPASGLSSDMTQGIPKKLQPKFRLLLSASPKARGSSKVLAKAPFFQNELAKSCTFVEEIAIKDKEEKEAFFARLDGLVDSFPRSVCKKKILPGLMAALDNGSASSRALGPILKIGGFLTDEEYPVLAERVTKWFSAPDFNLRVNLLQNIGTFATHLTPAMVSEGIFPQVVSGFAHESGALRELTVKAMVHLAPKLSAKLMVGQLLKCMAKLQLDPMPGIRTNTTICLAKLAAHIPEGERSKTLIAAFVRAMHDPFLHARVAGIQSLSATQQFYNKEDVAVRILPTLCKKAIDEEEVVRTQALTCIKAFVKKLEYISVHGEEQAAEQKGGVFGWVSSITSFYSGSKAQEAATGGGGSGSGGAAAPAAASSSKPSSLSASASRPAAAVRKEKEAEDEFAGFEDEEEMEEEEYESAEEDLVSAGYAGSSSLSRAKANRSSRPVGGQAKKASGAMRLGGAKKWQEEEKEEEKPVASKISASAWSWDDEEEEKEEEKEEEEEFEAFEDFDVPARQEKAETSPVASSFGAWGEAEEEEEQEKKTETAGGWGEWNEEEDGGDGDGWGGVEEELQEEEEEELPPKKAGSSFAFEEEEAGEGEDFGDGWGNDDADGWDVEEKEEDEEDKEAAVVEDGWGDADDWGADGDDWGGDEEGGDEDEWAFEAPVTPSPKVKRAGGKCD